MKTFLLHNTTIELASEKLRLVIAQNEELLIKKMKSNHFIIVSKKNYGSFNMVETQYYTIKGRLKLASNGVLITYKVNANETYKIMSMVLPIFLLPVLVIGLAAGDDLFWLSITAYTLAAIFSVVYPLLMDKSLRKRGKHAFESVIHQIQ